jgi:hypothetical protein
LFLVTNVDVLVGVGDGGLGAYDDDFLGGDV